MKKYALIDVSLKLRMRGLKKSEVGQGVTTFVGLFGSDPNDLYVDDESGNRKTLSDFLFEKEVHR